MSCQQKLSPHQSHNADFETERLLLRPFSVSDQDRLIEVASDWRIADATISVPHPFGLDEARAWLEKANGSPAGDRSFAIAKRESPLRMLGYVGLRNIDREHSEAELSFWIDRAEEGRGYSTEAANAAVSFGFQDVGLNRICAYHMVRNTASSRILAKIGMRPEGILRERVCKWGVFEDVQVWATLRSDQM